tara:strand:- start:646 stop:855 length:210 start_codon:yes stop_codon:yes gene_type:complete
MFHAFNPGTKPDFIKTICSKQFPQHFLKQLNTHMILIAVAIMSHLTHNQPLEADQPERPNIVLILADDK